MRIYQNKRHLRSALALGGIFLCAAAWAASPASGPELVVLLAATAGVPAAEAVAAGINNGHPPIDSLRSGAPVGARLGIRHRLTGQAAQDLPSRPDLPQARLQRYIVLTYPPDTDLNAVKKVLAQDPRIEAVGENVQGSFSTLPADPLFAPPLSSDPTQYQWGSYALNLPAAWGRSQGHAYVGLLDVGLMMDHPDLRAFHTSGGTVYYDGGNFRPQFSWDFDHFNYGPNVDELAPGGPPGFAGHGTHTSGIVAATPNNNLGVAGACWHCSLMMARDPRLPTNEIAEAFTWLANHGAQVINYSGFIPTTADKTCANLDPVQDAGIKMVCDALSLGDSQDVVFTVSSGNDVNDINFPARDLRVLAVGGLQPGNLFWREAVCPAAQGVPGLRGTQECGSNYTVTSGRRMQDLVAPAKDVLSTAYINQDWNTYIKCGDHFPQGVAVQDPTPGYGTCTGTSMAAPYVAGIAGLLRSVNPLLKKDDIRRLLLDHADRVGAWDPRYGYGVPDAGASVAAALGSVAGKVLPNRLTPLFSFYSSTAQDYFYTTVPQMAVGAILGHLNNTCDPQPGGGCTVPPALVPYASVGPQVPGYTNFPSLSCSVSPCSSTPAASVYVFTTEAPPFAGALTPVPLYRLSYKDLTPGSHHRDVTYTTQTAGILAFKAAGYELDGIEGYIYPQCSPEPSCIPAGAVRLYRRYNQQRDDFAIFPESELAQMESQGYTSTGGLNQILGYAYPNVDSDGDNLIDGFESLLGTNPQAADSDGDGVSDGVEALTFPYCDPLSPGCAGPSLWVSVAGNDGNTCSRDTPCRTFSGALAKVPPGGIIRVLSSGDFGQVTINKPVTLEAQGVVGGIQVGSGTAITISAGPNDKVVLRGLTLDGLGTASNGISFTAGGSLYVENCTVNNFGQYGLDFAPANGNGKLFVTDTLLRNNGAGAVGGGAHLVATTGTGFIASFDGLRSESNVFGLKAETLGVVTVRNSLAANNGYSGFSATTPSGSGSVRMLVENSVSTHNGTYGFLGANLATVTISNIVSTNNQFGLGTQAAGTILSFGNNKIQGNAVDGAPSQTLADR
jgi:serine protease